VPRRRVALSLLAALTSTLALAACGGAGGALGSDPTGRPSSTLAPGTISKVLVIVEENKEYDEIMGAPQAPYISGLTKEFGALTRLEAGYSPKCQSLPAYLILTSGSDHGICKDDLPKEHRLGGDNLFSQVTAAGKRWRVYGDGMPEPCAKGHADHKVFLVHHTMAPYYTAIPAEDCKANDIPMGDPETGAFARDVAAGLPDLSFLIPDSCHNMHGAKGCDNNRIGRGDRWLADTLPAVLEGPDYRANRLAIILTWDEGASKDNHIATLVIAPGARGVVSDVRATHCTTLRTISDLLGVEPLGCARGETSLRAIFGL
jgi:phospholipase C